MNKVGQQIARARAAGGIAARVLSAALGLLLLALAPVQAQNLVRTLNHVYAFDPEGEIELTTYKGNIAIVLWDQPKVQIDVRIEAEDYVGVLMLEDINIRIAGSEQSLKIETDYHQALREIYKLFDYSVSPRLPPVHYVIKMPRTARLKIDDYMSVTTITDFQADLDFYTYKGEVVMTNFGGTLRLDTFMGKAQVAFSPLARDSRIESHQGQVVVVLPGGVGFDLDVDLGTAQAIFASEASFAGLDPPGGVPSLLAGKKTTYRASINGGGARLSLVTHSGSVRLSQVENPK